MEASTHGHQRTQTLDASTAAGYQRLRAYFDLDMQKPQPHIRHIGRTFYLSEWWDE
jgi:hypothetical protein